MAAKEVKRKTENSHGERTSNGTMDHSNPDLRGKDWEKALGISQ
jgi:hypothetical protein